MVATSSPAQGSVAVVRGTVKKICNGSMSLLTDLTKLEDSAPIDGVVYHCHLPGCAYQIQDRLKSHQHPQDQLLLSSAP
jgi:hypothetical protein